MTTTTLLKAFIPMKKKSEDESCWKITPIEIEIFSEVGFEKSLSNFKKNFDKFVTEFEKNDAELEFEKDIAKCRFEKIVIEKIDFNSIV